MTEVTTDFGAEEFEEMLRRVLAFYGYQIGKEALHTVMLDTFYRLYMQNIHQEKKGRVH